MKFRKELILFSLLSIVFLAGCARGPSVPSGAGVIITSFTPDVQEVDAGSDVTFVVNLKNTGGKTSGAGTALFFGLSSDWTPAAQVKDVPTLAPADPGLGLTGEETSIDLTSKISSSAAKNTDVTYDASVRVLYGYTTTVDTLLRFVKSDYLRTAPNTPKGVQSSTSTAGPLLVTAFARTPSISADKTDARVQFEIQNIGPGRVFGGNIPTDGIVAAASLDEIKSITVKQGDASLPCGQSDVRLAGGKSKVISCDITVGNLVNFKDIALKVDIDYNYFIDSTTTVTVLKGLG